MRWYYRVGKRVWPYEVWNFLFREKRRRDGPTLTEFWGPPLDAEEAAIRRVMVPAVLRRIPPAPECPRPGPVSRATSVLDGSRRAVILSGSALGLDQTRNSTDTGA